MSEWPSAPSYDAQLGAREAIKRGYSPFGEPKREPPFGAIAYSPSTTRWASAFGSPDREHAERLALVKCEAPDAKIVVWGQDKYLALAIGLEGAHGSAKSEEPTVATSLALLKCRKRNRPRIAVFIHTSEGPCPLPR